MTWETLLYTITIMIVAIGAYRLGQDNGTNRGYIVGTRQAYQPIFELIASQVEISPQDLARLLDDQERDGK